MGIIQSIAFSMYNTTDVGGVGEVDPISFSDTQII